MERRKSSIRRDPPKKSLDIVYMHAENKRRLEKSHEESLLTNPAIKFHPFAESIIIDFLDSKESHKKFIHPLEFKAIVEQHIVLMDNLAGKPALVAMIGDKKTLHCDTCDSDTCYHVGFAYGNTSASNILVKKGFFQTRL